MDPIRTCVGCGTKAPQRELARFVVRKGMLAYDPTGSAPGRGAYTCRRAVCLERAAARRAFPRALRQIVRVPGDLQGVWNEG